MSLFIITICPAPFINLKCNTYIRAKNNIEDDCYIIEDDHNIIEDDLYYKFIMSKFIITIFSIH